MSRYVKDENKAPTVWTPVTDKTVNGQKLSVYFSDGGCLKITRHTDKGEQTAFMYPAGCLDALVGLSDQFEAIKEAYESISDQVAETKAARKEADKLEAAKKREQDRLILEMVAAEERRKLIQEKLAKAGIKIA